MRWPRRLRGRHEGASGTDLQVRRLRVVAAAPGGRNVWGYRFRPTSQDPRTRGLVDALLSGLPETAEAAVIYDLDTGAESAEASLVALVSAVNLAAIDAAAGSLLLHAGAASTSDGDTAIVCGRSGSGKTTLTIRLVEAGLSYVTDEAVRLDPACLSISAYRKPAVIKPGAQGVLSHLRPAEWLGATPWLVQPSRFETTPLPAAPLSPALLVFPTFRDGQPLEVERMDEATTAYLLASDSSRLQDVLGGALPALARLARRAPAYRILHSDAVQAAAVVRELLDAA